VAGFPSGELRWKVGYGSLGRIRKVNPLFREGKEPFQ